MNVAELNYILLIIVMILYFIVCVCIIKDIRKRGLLVPVIGIVLNIVFPFLGYGLYLLICYFYGRYNVNISNNKDMEID